MGSSSTSSVYIQVIEDVITKVREEFITNGGPGEGVLNELQGIWELKMMQAGAVFGPNDRSSSAKLPALGAPANTVRDLNVPYEGPEEFETPTADLLFPPTPLQTPIQTPLPGRIDHSYNIPTASTPITPNNHPPVDENDQSGRPSQFMQPPSSWLNQRPRLDVNVVYEEGDRETAHQNMAQDFLQLTSGKRKREEFPSQYRPSGYIPQQDGSGDVVADEFEIYNYQGVVNEDYNVANTPAPPELQGQTPSLVNQNDALDDDEDEALNENDDDLDDVDDGNDDDEEVNTQNLVLAQFDKVTRAKNRWKCTLKDGVMHINNRDILFNKASGEFDF
ncbi:unnamed protein product [Lactuca virosa]|uniref:Uncharacterized protein n=1 Tax=Lactuca virosa TaxID=75947 RepID=A0AAU9P9L8_9ASTR|nr:unnamed protein product [Lactuca virosa]